MCTCERWRIRITGTVQGVGFRPFIYRTATGLGLSGIVRNTPAGVTIEAQGNASTLAAFVDGIQERLPPLAEIRSLAHENIPLENGHAFAIEQSTVHSGELTPAIAPDIATCDNCLAEIRTAGDRRHRYAFTNCTDCGPRYTIIEGFPYDRPKTSMKHFQMCTACAAEYNDPANRRFHAQPNACPDCGPQLNSSIEAALDTLSDGKIVAIKGLGGFHLACNALDDNAVKRLRERKHRDVKPFAVMVRDLDAARSVCHITDEEAKLLTSPWRPIVLLRKRSNIAIAESVAPGNKLLGIMLPYTPLHHLLFESRITNHESRFLVMTSANFSDEPLIIDNDEAQERLARVADSFLIHDRPIHMRTDDSVIRRAGARTIMMRRARGYVPSPIALPFAGPRVLALGGDIKNAFCLTSGMNAYLSQHIGDLANPEAHAHFERTVTHLCSLLKIEPAIIACDMHPGYFSSMYGSRITDHVSRVFVQHHHAHIASCMAEHGLPNEKVVGIALDGAGYGPDGTIWGGEVLKADYADYERVGRIKPMPQPSGDAAAREPWRMALAYMQGSGIRDQRSEILSTISEGDLQLVSEAIEKNINCPLTSSCGRLFDAVAAIAGLATHNAYEGHAAMLLEQEANESVEGSYEFNLNDAGDGGTREIDFRPTTAAVMRDVLDGTNVSTISAKFHHTVIEAFVHLIDEIGGSEPVVLSGGCMQNALLLQGLTKSLEARGRTVYTHALVPPNDGGIALGQAAIAAHQYR